MHNLKGFTVEYQLMETVRDVRIRKNTKLTM